MKKAYYLLPNAITQIGFKNIGEGPVEAAVRKKGYPPPPNIADN